MKIGDRFEKITTKAFYKVLETNSNGKIVLQRLINGSKSDNLLIVDDLNSFKAFKPIENTISFFDDNYDFLSTLYESPVEYEGVIYPSVEHAFQASKTNEEKDIQKILSISSPLKVKVLGKAIKEKEGWKENQYNEMYKICLNKFKNNEELKLALLDTKDMNLINGGEDTYWGYSKDKECGDNNLGKILMEIRKELSN